jgi:hypothetical protein
MNSARVQSHTLCGRGKIPKTGKLAKSGKFFMKKPDLLRFGFGILLQHIFNFLSNIDRKALAGFGKFTRLQIIKQSNYI